jgi:DNA-binding MarR family transcriptional regulator
MSRVKLSPEFEQRWPESSSKATECALNVIRTNDLFLKLIEGIQRPLGLSNATGLTISVLANAKEPISPHEVSERLVVTRATVTGLLDSLERKGYATRKPHPTDRRMLLVEITDEGRRVADEMREQIHRMEKKWFEVLSREEQEQFIQFMWRIQDRLEMAGKTE